MNGSLIKLFEKLHLEKIGILGSFISVFCCLGFGPLVVILSALGAGFLINDAILAPLLIAFLMIGGIGLIFSFRRHHAWGPLALHAAAAITVFVFIFVVYIQLMVWVGITGLLGASVWNIFIKRRQSCEITSSATGEPCSTTRAA